MTEYAYILFSRDWTELTVAINELSARYRHAKRPVAAGIVERAWSEARSEQIAMAKEMAALATKELRDEERRTRVRPDTEGGGGPRLETYLEADVLPHQNLLPGSIGVANEDLLNANVPWWITNEIGNTTLVGRRIFGLFYGGDEDSPPNADEFRVHPLFAPAPASAGGGPGTIEHGIPERRFIQKAIFGRIDREWHLRFDAIKTKLIGELAHAAVVER